jgi:hypothetical protein
MPSLIGALKIVNNPGTLNNGDTLVISPTTNTKQFRGAGETTGDFSSANTFISIILVNDPDVIDNSPSKIATGT